MTRVAIYARYSSEHQNERSIEDQVRLCRDYLSRQGWTEAGIFADYAMSGAHLRSRPQALAMLEAVRAGDVDVVLAEALDRLSRDQEDIAGVHKRVAFAGARIVTATEGEISELHVGLKGTMNALFLKDLAAKIRRGQLGRAVAGYIPGGKAYGYDVVRGRLDERGEPIKGLREINHSEAAVIRRIFEEYAAGSSAKTIAHGLNRDLVPAPHGGLWGPSTISGNRARGSGILWNEAFCGRLVYNRVRMVKDPESGKRVSRPNTREDWTIIDMPGLRIVDDTVWTSAQEMKRRFDALSGPQRPAQKHLLSGLIRCACCGGTFQIKHSGRMACATRRQKGPAACQNDRTVVLSSVTERIVAGIRRQLLKPEMAEQFVRTYNAERKKRRAERKRTAGRAATRLREVESGISNLVDAITKVGATDSMLEQMQSLEAEKRELVAAVEPVDDTVIELHPNVVGDYQRAVNDLIGILSAEAPVLATARQRFAAVIDHIAVHPLPGRGCVELRAMTRIDALFPTSSGTSFGQLVGSGGGT